jgi:hypothetical protein
MEGIGGVDTYEARYGASVKRIDTVHAYDALLRLVRGVSTVLTWKTCYAHVLVATTRISHAPRQWMWINRRPRAVECARRNNKLPMVPSCLSLSDCRM